MTNTNKDIFSIYYPTYILTKCFGLAGYNIKGPLNFRFMEKSTKYDILSRILYAFVLLFVLYSITVTDLGRNTPTASVILIFHYVRKWLITGCVLSIIIINKLYNLEIVSLLNELYSVNKHLDRMGYKLQYDNLKIITITYLLALFTPVVIFAGILTTEDATSVIITMGFLIFTISIIIYTANFLTIVLIFVYLLRGINHSLTQSFLHFPKNILSGNSRLRNNKNIIKDTAMIHQKMTANLRVFNKCFSVQNLLIIAEHCCTLIASILAAIYSGVNHTVIDIILCILMTFGNVLRIGTFVFLSALCRKEVSNNYQHKISLV